MKNKFLLSPFLLASVLISCSGAAVSSNSSSSFISSLPPYSDSSSDSSTTDVPPFSISVDSLEIVEGNTARVSIKNINVSASKAVWTIEDSSIAQAVISSTTFLCTIKALKSGSTELNVRLEDYDDYGITIPVVVKAKEKTPSISLSESQITNYVGDSFSIDATLEAIDSSQVSWSVGDSSILKMNNKNGNSISFTALGVGNTYIRAEWTGDSSIYAECLVSIINKVESTWPVISEEAGDYYSSIDFTAEPSQLITELYNLSKSNRKSNSYDDVWSILEYAEADPENEENVILFYSGESRKFNKSNINREHVWPKSRGIKNNNAASSDPHMLHLTDTADNGARGNDVYGDKNDSTAFYVELPEYQGAAARSVFYMHVTYSNLGLILDDDSSYKSGSSKNMGKISVLLKWDAMNPVASYPFEMRRNGRIQDKINTRNPFVDIPGLGLYLYGGINENTKEIYHEYAAEYGLNPTMY